MKNKLFFNLTFWFYFDNSVQIQKFLGYLRGGYNSANINKTLIHVRTIYFNHTSVEQ